MDRIASMEDVVPKISRDLSRFKKKPEPQASDLQHSGSSNNGSKHKPSLNKESCSFVKYTSGTSNFEDLKMKAKDSWFVGVDLKLKEDIKKPKQQWIAEDDFFKSKVARKTTDPSPSLWQPNLESDWQPENSKTYAQAANPDIPAWADTPEPMVFAQQDVSFDSNPENTVHPVSQHPKTTLKNHTDILNPKDRETSILLYKVINKNDSESIEYFRQSYQQILNNLPDTPLRIVGYFFEALAKLLEYDYKNGQNETIQKITAKIQPLFVVMDNYIRNYAVLPNEYLQVLKFSVALYKYRNMISDDIPLQELMLRCKSLIEFCTIDDHVKICIALHALIGDSWEESINDKDAVLKTPGAKDFVLETLLSSKNNQEVFNVTHGPWPNLDLRNYLYTHYNLRRKDLMEPVKCALSNLLDPGNSHFPQDDVVVCPNSKPIGTVPHTASFNVAIVFSLVFCAESDEIMQNDIEGFFVFIFPDHNYSTLSINQRIELASLGSIMGYALGSVSTVQNEKNICLLPVHLNRNEASRLDWSKTYTLITTRNNALSTLATLNWLEGEYTNFNTDHFSTTITPRVLAAKNDISSKELSMFSEYTVEDVRDIPSYLQDIELDISSLMLNKNGNVKARPDRDIWPTLSGQWNTASPPRRPSPYETSPSQLRAIKYALNHRVAVISGAPGTGKTYLAGKLALLLSQALEVGQFRQPLLVISKSQFTLDRILKSVSNKVPNTVRFGYDTNTNQIKQATNLAKPTVTDQDYRLFQRLERCLGYIQAKLDLLCKKRAEVEGSMAIQLAHAIPPAYLTQLHDGYKQRYGRNAVSSEELWDTWLSIEKKTVVPDLSVLQSVQKARKGALPMIDTESFTERNQWVFNNPAHCVPIKNAIHWPFETSVRTGADLREELLECWKSNVNLWDMSKDQRTGISNNVIRVLLKYIDYDIQSLLKEQALEASALDNMMIKKWTYLVRFNRVIGITADFAAAQQSWLAHVWPLCIIVDDASEIMESTLAPVIFGPRVEHLILLGNEENSSRPIASNSKLKGHPHHIEVSLFERWKKNTPSEVSRLEEQWRIHSDMANILDTFNSGKDKDSPLLITAPLVTCNENMRDNKKMALYGLNHRLFFIDYQTIRSVAQASIEYSYLSYSVISQAEVDEAQFIAHLATYISQQPYTSTFSVAVLTVCDLQKKLVTKILKDCIPKRTVFKRSLEKINVGRIDEQMGREYWFTIISTSTPGKSKSTKDNLSMALSRAKYGTYIVGKPGKDRVHARWDKFGLYMREKNLCGHQISLTCQNHQDTLSVSFWADFQRIKNGGCDQPCKTLMADGHACPEECHHGSHEEVICQELCNRIRICPHPCLSKCFECNKNSACPPCNQTYQVNLDCGHKLTLPCFKVPEKSTIKCQALVDATLPCKHTANIKCFETKNLAKITCNKKNIVMLRCGHSTKTRCGTEFFCTEICNKQYGCNIHPCQELAAQIPIIIHKDALKNVDILAYMATDAAYIVLKSVYVVLVLVRIHMCDRPPCNAPCREVFKCLHQCPGLCGEPCPPCAKCRPDLKCTISLRTLGEFEENESVYMLPNCGCVFSVESLDAYFRHQVTSGEHKAIKLWECPHCKKNIYTAGRYNNYIKTEVALVNKIKAHLESERRKITDTERVQIVEAMNQEVKNTGIHNIVGGRWFVCPNKHPYYVGDCGGATEISDCPECGESIGGTQHRVVESNRFYGEFDGSNEPAWPGQPNSLG